MPTRRVSMPTRSLAAAAFVAALLATTAQAQQAPPPPAGQPPHETRTAPPDARVHIIWPKNGQVIKGGKFWLRMGLSGMGVAPAGVVWPNTGHHHVLIDTDPPPQGEPIPNDRNHLHFGKGQTEARIELPPGRHTLQLMLGDEGHYPFDPPLLSERITVIVKE